MKVRTFYEDYNNWHKYWENWIQFEEIRKCRKTMQTFSDIFVTISKWIDREDTVHNRVKVILLIILSER